MATAQPTAQEIQDLYLKTLQGTTDSSPLSLSDINKQYQDLSALFPGPQKSSIYDLASSISQGLSAQAASGRPPSVGYGLATGFQLFNEAESKKKAAAEELRKTLMLKAYEKTEALRAEQAAFRKAAAEGGLKYALEALKKEEGYFTSNSLLSNAAKYITDAQEKARAGDTSMIYDTAGNLKPVYIAMMAIAEKETVSQQTVDGEPFTITEKGLNIPRFEPPATTIESGGKTYTYTGTKDPGTGKLIYLDEAGGQHLLESKGAGG
jgi:flagellar hook-basal body complex protein FliE